MDVWRGALFLPMVFLVIQKAGGHLVENFYESSCPNVEGIVKEMVFAKYMQANFSVPATLRLFFHDCFIEVGCMVKYHCRTTALAELETNITGVLFCPSVNFNFSCKFIRPAQSEIPWK